MQNKYDILVNILDNLCKEAPERFNSYHNLDSEDKIVTARSRAFIHLLLKVRFGLLKFLERENRITDGSQDGGIDAYLIDKENKKIFFIQSKFRNSAENFDNKTISANDLIKMEIKNIINGKTYDSRGVEFNSKIKQFIHEYSTLDNHAAYNFKVIFLGNLRNYTDEQIKKLTDGFEYEVYNFERTYKELIYSICSGLHFRPEDIYITINLSNKPNPLLEQTISTDQGDFEVRITFVPTKEVGRIMSQYKNALLQYNPRNYLTLSENSVNKKIAESITDKKSNEFVILNNGITVFAKRFNFSSGTGKKNRGQILITNPQIINGGQTAYTLGHLFEEKKNEIERLFGDKEVLLKVIISENSEEMSPKFINSISNATNQQTKVDESDRRSNDDIQIRIQGLIYDNFGYYYERKKGEFYPGVSADYIHKDLIIKRDNFVRAYYASKGFPANARSSASDTLFSIKKFNEILDNSDNFKSMVFAYFIHKNLFRLKKEEWGNGIRYGKFAIVYAIFLKCNLGEFKNEEYETKAKEEITKIQKRWKQFEEHVKNKKANKSYYYEEGDFDFDGYYKGKNLSKDIREFFADEKKVKIQGN